jgi:hypothetical protein
MRSSPKFTTLSLFPIRLRVPMPWSDWTEHCERACLHREMQRFSKRQGWNACNSSLSHERRGAYLVVCYLPSRGLACPHFVSYGTARYST